MKRLIAALMIVAFAAVPAMAELPSIKQGVKDKMPAMTTPQQKIKQIPKTAVVPQTGQEEGIQEAEPQEVEAQPETQEPTPQATPNIEFQDIVFMPASPSSTCQLKWIVTFHNAGAATGNLVLSHTYRKEEGSNEVAGPELSLPPLSADAAGSSAGFIPLLENDENEVVLVLREGSTILARAIFPLPLSVRPSAENVALSEPIFSDSTISFEIRNTGNGDLKAITYLVQCKMDPAGSTVQRLAYNRIDCLPVGASESISLDLPATPFHSVWIRLTTSTMGETIFESTYMRP